MKPYEPCSSADRAEFEQAVAAIEVCPRCCGCGWQMCDWWRLSREAKLARGMRSSLDCEECSREEFGPMMPMRFVIKSTFHTRVHNLYVSSHECAVCDGKGLVDRATAVAEVIWNRD